VRSFAPADGAPSPLLHTSAAPGKGRGRGRSTYLLFIAKGTQCTTLAKGRVTPTGPGTSYSASIRSIEHCQAKQDGYTNTPCNRRRTQGCTVMVREVACSSLTPSTSRHRRMGSRTGGVRRGTSTRRHTTGGCRIPPSSVSGCFTRRGRGAMCTSQFRSSRAQPLAMVTSASKSNGAQGACKATGTSATSASSYRSSSVPTRKRTTVVCCSRRGDKQPIIPTVQCA
jgi:hypothetical protein